jgi:hypothetical protein
LAVAIALFLSCFVPALCDWNMMNGGFAWVMVMGFATLVACIATWIYWGRGRQAESLIAGTGDFIAEWSVPAALWQEIIQREYREEKSAKRQLLMIVWFFCIATGVAFILYDHVAGPWVGAVMVVVMLATGLAAALTPGARLRRQSAAETRVRVGRGCVMLGDELHTWSRAGSCLRSVELQEEPGLHWLRIRYAFFTRAGMQEAQVLLPVPPREVEKARQAAAELATK